MRLIIIGIVLLLGQGLAAQNQRIAYIESQAILKAMPAYKKAQSDLESFTKQLEKQLQNAQNKAQSHYSEVMDSIKQQIMTPRQQKAAEVRLQQMQTDLQQSAMSAERRLTERETQLVEPVYETFNKAVAKVAKENNYTYVLDKQFMIYSTGGIDATTKVKTALGIP